MARLVRQTMFNDLCSGDIFRLAGVRARRFRFLAFVTNLDNGHAFIEAVDVTTRRMRALRPDAGIVRDARASRLARARANGSAVQARLFD